MKKQAFYFMTILFIAMLSAISLGDVQTVTGEILKVTVYHGQALITRLIPVDLPKGSSEIIVNKLPSKILPESIYAESSDGIKVLSLRYRSRAVKADTREEVKQLDVEIEEIKRQQYQARRNNEISDWLFRHFDPLWKWTVDATNVNLNRSIIDAGAIEKLTSYLEQKANQWHERNVKMEFLRQDLQKQLELLERKRKDLAAERAKTEREVVLYLNKSNDGISTIELKYLVTGADWLPQYNLRGEPDDLSVFIEYNAVINQTSGENWDSVVLSLSTAEPAMVASVPTLQPLNIGLMPRHIQQNAQMDMAKPMVTIDGFKDLVQRKREAGRKGKAAEMELRKIAMDNQAWELNSSRGQILGINEELKQIRRIEGISVTYDLQGKITLPSRNDQQLATIATVKTQADFTLIATPLLTDYVYLQADLLNQNDIIFLPGQASVFRNGQFVGKSQMPVVTIGEKFTTGFGIDSQVQVTRELEDKKTKIQGGNRIDTFQYRIALENYKKTPVKLRLIDRLPCAEDRSIKIELNNGNFDLSEDKEYVRKDKKKGLLRWDLELEPNTIDDNATEVKYGYTAEYDRNMQIKPL